MSKIEIQLLIEDEPHDLDVILYRLNKITEVIRFDAFHKDKLLLSYSKKEK